MSTPIIKVGCVANIFSRMMHFENIGDIEYGHSHTYDHLTLLASGKLKITIDNQSTEFIAPHMIFIKKEKIHILESLEPNTIAYCIHALKNKDTEDILDASMIPKGANPLDYSIKILK